MTFDLLQDMAGCIVKVASFLGRTLTPSQVSEIAAHCSFSQMSANPAVNYTWWDDVGRHKTETKFMRKGKKESGLGKILGRLLYWGS